MSKSYVQSSIPGGGQSPRRHRHYVTLGICHAGRLRHGSLNLKACLSPSRRPRRGGFSRGPPRSRRSGFKPRWSRWLCWRGKGKRSIQRSRQRRVAATKIGPSEFVAFPPALLCQVQTFRRYGQHVLPTLDAQLPLEGSLKFGCHRYPSGLTVSVALHDGTTRPFRLCDCLVGASSATAVCAERSVHLLAIFRNRVRHATELHRIPVAGWGRCAANRRNRRRRS